MPIRLIALLMVGMSVVGCVGVARIPQAVTGDPESLWLAQQQRNRAVAGWSLKGKIGVRAGRKGGSATLNWDYAGNNQGVELYGPFGGGRVHITATPERAELRDNRGRVTAGATVQEVLAARLGWHVPFAELVDWSRGLPGADATQITIDKQGRLQSLHQGIWRVDYREYRRVGELNLPWKMDLKTLPGKLELYDDDGNYIGDELSVRLVLKNWRDIELNPVLKP